MENRGPLAGVRVIDVSHQAAGPWCTTLLGDMGADVWKIEKPGRGDSIRYARGADPKIGSFNFWGLNRNKRSVGVDIKHPDGAALVREMVDQADVLVENFRPGVMVRLGLGYDALREGNPRLIYASITAFGKTGPWAQNPGMDLILQATGGMMGLSGFPGGPPVKAAGPVADISSGIYCAYAIALALLHREKTGCGQRIDLTMLDAVISLLADISTAFLNTGHRYEKFGNGHPDLVPYQAFEARDGYFIVACLTNAFCRRLSQGLGREDRLADARFAPNNARPACRGNDLNGRVEMEETAAIGSVANWEHPAHGPFRTMNVPIHLSETPGSLRIPPARLGEHTDAALRDLGKSADEIARLRNDGVCGE